MVSGLVTSPWDHDITVSGEARERRRASKFSSFSMCLPCLQVVQGLVQLVTFEVDSKIDRRFRKVVLGQRDLALVVGEDLDAQPQAFQLLDQDAEGLGDAGVEGVLALYDGLISLDAAYDVVRLDGQDLLEDMARAVGLHRPDLHLAQAPATALGLAPPPLLGDQAVRARRPRM